jgi:hypothetical protein
MPSKSANGIELGRLADAVREAIAASQPLPQPHIVANDEELTWRLIPFPDGWNAVS